LPASSFAGGIAPRDAGARYGQALGASELCYGSTLTEKAKTLGDAYTGDDLAAFKAQAAKIYEAWTAVKGCMHQDDPNQCKIIMDKSCLAAEAEIGADGSALAGLVAFPNH
jgi:hypothetical protein